REPGVRPEVAPLERVRGLVRVRVEAERVHERTRSSASSVPGAERPQEPDGRGGDVVPRVGAVVPARGQPDADDSDRRVDGLQDVVRGREVRPEGRSRQIGARGVELRAPERGLVRLVPDDELPNLRVDGYEDA